MVVDIIEEGGVRAVGYKTRNTYGFVGCRRAALHLILYALHLAMLSVVHIRPGTLRLCANLVLLPSSSSVYIGIALASKRHPLRVGLASQYPPPRKNVHALGTLVACTYIRPGRVLEHSAANFNASA